ncbi:unnamed protein product [Paramecium primaurelia]|uniref:Protein kinase domain-containing protein n=1 Tax=Paramecium primaurelia TaxID=5886 RepID=A0A8S1Q8B5_PARPR|nr:unnamed protein product [Paramecium primaurelia]
MLQFRRTIFDQNEDTVMWKSDNQPPPLPLQQQGNVLMKSYDKYITVYLEICPERLYKRLSSNQLVYCTLDKCRLKKFSFYDQVLPHHKYGITLQLRDQQETFLIDSPDEFRKWFLLFKRYCVLDKFKQKFKVLNKSKMEDPLFGQCYYNCIHSNNYKLVKIIDKANITNYQLQCLSKEISSLRKLNSPLIIFFNELYEDDSNIYIVYNHYQGLDMRNWIKENSQNLEERLVAQIMFNLLTAISHMHSRGVFHRDIKLDSILIQSQLPSVLLTNFCYSETYIPQTTYKKCGTPGFIAPEIFKTKLYTPKADMFSLGCLFYVLYFGKIPFSGSTQEEILQKNEAAVIDYQIQKQLCRKVSSSGINLLKALLISDPEQRLSAQQALQHHWFIKMGTKQQAKFHKNIIKGKSLSTIIENSVDITHSIQCQIPSSTFIEDKVDKEFTADNLKDRLQKFNSIQLKPSKHRHQYYQ